MKKFRAKVNCTLDRAYDVAVEAEDEEMAHLYAENEVYREIDPSDIDVLAFEVEEIDE